MLTIMRFGCCAILALSACYAPQVFGGAPCDPSRDSCPTGQTCEASGSGHFCSSGRQEGDGGVDTPIVTGTNCYGSASGLLGSLCFATAPITPLTLAAGSTVNTATIGAGNCTEIRAQTGGGPSLCVIAASTIDVASGAAVRVVGSNPIVLVAVQTIQIDGTLDASSRVSDLPGATGAGARSAIACNAAGIDGTTSTNGINGGGGGGAAGGSFSGLGGAGGNGKGQPGALHGSPAMPSSTTALVGGCPGGRGGHGNGNCPGVGVPCGGGPGGNGGGAIYVIAGGSITVGGSIDASGQGGAGGTDGFNNSGGGGGGGTGGLIGLDAPHITVTGSVFANGGGGGGGGGSTEVDHGQAGTDPTASAVAAQGGTGGLDNGSGTAGGDGGAGSVGKTVPGTGKAGTQVDSAGGGGGGGPGLVRVFGVPAASVTGAISPSPT